MDLIIKAKETITRTYNISMDEINLKHINEELKGEGEKKISMDEVIAIINNKSKANDLTKDIVKSYIEDLFNDIQASYSIKYFEDGIETLSIEPYDAILQDEQLEKTQIKKMQISK